MSVPYFSPQVIAMRSFFQKNSVETHFIITNDFIFLEYCLVRHIQSITYMNKDYQNTYGKKRR